MGSDNPLGLMPEPAHVPAGDGLVLGLNFNAVQVPDGTYHVTVSMSMGSMVVNIVLCDIDSANTIADQIANNIKRVAREARRVRSGLVLPGEVNNGGGANGHSLGNRRG